MNMEFLKSRVAPLPAVAADGGGCIGSSNSNGTSGLWKEPLNDAMNRDRCYNNMHIHNHNFAHHHKSSCSSSSSSSSSLQRQQQLRLLHQEQKAVSSSSHHAGLFSQDEKVESSRLVKTSMDLDCFPKTTTKDEGEMLLLSLVPPSPVQKGTSSKNDAMMTMDPHPRQRKEGARSFRTRASSSTGTSASGKQTPVAADVLMKSGSSQQQRQRSSTLNYTLPNLPLSVEEKYEAGTKNKEEEGRPTKAIPISAESMKRTASELQLLEDEAMADFRDYCMFTRIVNGMVERRSWTTELPSCHQQQQDDDDDGGAIRSIIRTRHRPVPDGEVAAMGGGFGATGGAGTSVPLVGISDHHARQLKKHHSLFANPAAGNQQYRLPAASGTEAAEGTRPPAPAAATSIIIQEPEDEGRGIDCGDDIGCLQLRQQRDDSTSHGQPLSHRQQQAHLQRQRAVDGYYGNMHFLPDPEDDGGVFFMDDL